MELNRQDNGNRKCILVTNNEITDINPNGIANDVTTKRLKRVMSGECYDKSKNFEWIKKNAPYGDNLCVYRIESISKYAQGNSTHPLTPSAREGEENHPTNENLSVLDAIDECAYGLQKFESIHDKAKWIAKNFCVTLNILQSDSEYAKRKKGE